jgi:hypothetical protein
MLSSFKSSIRERRERRERRKSSLCPAVEDEELVIETREHSLRGVIGDEGPSGTNRTADQSINKPRQL